MSKRIIVAEQVIGLQDQEMVEIASSPATPASGKGKIYLKTDGLFYTKNDAGVEKEVSPSLAAYELQANKGAANGYASLDANSKVPIAQIPAAVMERIVVVADQAARFALTTATVQDGDCVKQTDTGVMYFVKDDTNLGNASGYEVFAAGTAASVPWSGITGMDEQVSDLAAVAYTGNAGKVLAVNGTEDAWELIVPSGGGADTDLGNLTATAINEDLVFDKIEPQIKSKDETAINSRNIYLRTGAVTGTTDQSGVVNINSGTTVDGNSGNIAISTGSPSGSGTRGTVDLGGSAINLNADDTVLLAAPTHVELQSAVKVILDTPDIEIQMAAIIHTRDESAVPSEPLTIKTGNVTGTTDSSGGISITTGSTIDGNSGSITLQPAVPSGSGTRGTIALDGDVNLTTGNIANFSAGDTVISSFAPNINTDSSKAVAVGMIHLMSGIWKKYTVKFDSYSWGAVNTSSWTFNTLPGVVGSIEKVIVKPKVAFAAPSLTSLLVDVGLDANLNLLADDVDGLTVSASNVLVNSANEIVNGNAVKVTLTSIGNTLDNLTAGEVDIWIKYLDLESQVDLL